MRGSLTVLAVLTLLTTSVSPAAAETELQKYLKAGQTFESLKAETLKKGDVPHLSDPRVRDTLAILANVSRTFGSPLFPFDDDAMKSGLCSVAVRATATYVLFGLEAFAKEKGLSPASNPEAFAEATLELQGRNAIKFQDEVFPLLEFSERCSAATLPWLATFIEKLPPEQLTEVRREGLRKVRLGVMEEVIGDIGSLNYEGLREGNRRLLFTSVARDLPALSAALPLEVRAQLRRTVEKLSSAAPREYQSEIAAMLKTLSDSQCQGLCRF